MQKMDLLVTTCCVLVALGNPILGQEKDFNAYSDHVTKYLDRLYDEDTESLAYRQGYSGGYDQWQKDARTALHSKLGLEKIAASVGDHEPVVELGEPDDSDSYTRQRGTIETEPDVRIPFWLLKPEGNGPWPLGVFPHGHDSRGHDTTVGVYADAAHEKKSLAEDRDVAVQAVKLGFVAIAPAVRGLATDGVPDLYGRHGNQSCRSHVMHCLLAGRTAMGERVWDMQRIIDWALKMPDVDGRDVLMMGNSGGGMVTIFASACDERITIAVPNCSFAPTVSEAGYIFHCDCNMVPGLLEIGGLPGVAGLIAPRHLLAVNGRKDTLFSQAEIERAATQVRTVYKAAGCPERFEHRWGEEGHRFYKNLMWPFVTDALRFIGAVRTRCPVQQGLHLCRSTQKRIRQVTIGHPRSATRYPNRLDQVRGQTASGRRNLGRRWPGQVWWQTADRTVRRAVRLERCHWPHFGHGRIQFNGYDVSSSGIYEHWLRVDTEKATVIYDRSGPHADDDKTDYWLTIDVRRAGASILTAPVTFQATYIVALPVKVKMQPGDEIITSLDFREDGDWQRVGKEIRYRLREGAPFTFGRALGLGTEPIDHGTQLYIDGVAVFNRVLMPGELKALAFNEATQTKRVACQRRQVRLRRDTHRCWWWVGRWTLGSAARPEYRHRRT